MLFIKIIIQSNNQIFIKISLVSSIQEYACDVTRDISLVSSSLFIHEFHKDIYNLGISFRNFNFSFNGKLGKLTKKIYAKGNLHICSLLQFLC